LGKRPREKESNGCVRKLGEGTVAAKRTKESTAKDVNTKFGQDSLGGISKKTRNRGGDTKKEMKKEKKLPFCAEEKKGMRKMEKSSQTVKEGCREGFRQFAQQGKQERPGRQLDERNTERMQ